MHVAGGELPVALADVAQPAADGVVVVRAEVADAVRRAAVRQVVRVPVRVKGKLHNLHPGQAGVVQQLAHAGGHITEILGDEVQIVEPGGEHAHKLHAGAGLPDAVFGGRLPVGDGPVALQAAEVVDADAVVEAARALDAADPPAVAVALHRVPVVKRVAPELPVVRKGIGRDAGDRLGDVLAVELEILRLAPYVGGIQGHVDGDVADEGNALAVGIFAQRVPLAEEEELHKDVKIHLLAQLLAPALHGLGAVHADVLVRPLRPGQTVKLRLERHVQGVGLHPRPVLPKRFDLVGKALLPAYVCYVEQGQTVFGQTAVIDGAASSAPAERPGLLRLEQPVLHQKIEVDVIGVAREGGEGGVGAVAHAGGTEREKLPVFLPGGFQKVHKFKGAFAHRADPVGGGQRAHRHQHAAAAFHHDP